MLNFLAIMTKRAFRLKTQKTGRAETKGDIFRILNDKGIEKLIQIEANAGANPSATMHMSNKNNRNVVQQNSPIKSGNLLLPISFDNQAPNGNGGFNNYMLVPLTTLSVYDRQSLNRQQYQKTYNQELSLYNKKE